MFNSTGGRGWAARAWERVRYAWAVAKAYYRFYFLARFLDGSAFMVYKAVAVDEEAGVSALVTRAFDLNDWEESVRVATGWTTERVRVDVRYLAHGRKYRLVLRRGDTAHLGSLPERHRGGPKGVIAAELRGVGDCRSVDITRRVLKYQGPARDFHSAMGLRVSVTEMFPYDDAAELMHSFATLVLVDSFARTHVIPIACDDVASALKTP